jgi:AraC family transcriptional activator FtrA
VVALALPAVEAFDLAIPAQVFADPGLPRRYEFTVCAPAAGLVRSTAGFSVQAEHGLEALAAADTVVVPGYLPLDDPGERVCSALRQAAARGARMVTFADYDIPMPYPSSIITEHHHTRAQDGPL